MKRWQDFLLWVVLFVLWDTLAEFIKSSAEAGILSDWFFVLLSLGVFVSVWIAVFFGVRTLKNKKVKKTEKKKSFLTWGTEFVLFWSVCVTFDVAIYLLEHNMLNGWLLLGVCMLFMFIGFVGGRLNDLLFKPKNK